MHGRKILPIGFDAIVPVTFGAVIIDGIEKNEGIGTAAHRAVFSGFVELGIRPGGGGDVSSGGTSPRGEFVGVDSEFFRVAANPSHGGLTVLDTFAGIRAGVFLGAVVCADCDHPARGEVAALRVEL